MTPIPRIRALAAALLALALPLGLGLPAGAAVSGPPVEINVLLPLTGSGAFIGNATKKDLDLIEGLVNGSGGIGGRPVKFVVGDDQANPQVSVQLTSALVAKHVPVVLGGVLAGNCRAMAPLVAKSGPMHWCLSPGIHPTRGSYTFSASVGTLDDAIGTVRFFREKGWTKVAILTTNDAIGQELDRSYASAFALPENKSMQIVADEHFNPTDLSVAAQVAAIKASGAQAVLTWVTGTPFGTMLRGFHDAGLDLPISSSTGNMSFVQMAQYTGFIPKQLYFAGLRSITREGTLPGPVKEAQDVYFGAFKAAGVRPDVLNAIGWDPVMIVIDAYRHIGPNATADQLRDYVDNLHGYAGTSGVYDFSDPEQRGLTISALVVDQWDPAKNDFVPASRPGGGNLASRSGNRL